MAEQIETTNVVTRFVTEYDKASGRRAASEAQKVSKSIDGGFTKAGRESEKAFKKIESDSKKSFDGVERNFKRSENRLVSLFKGFGAKIAALGIGAAIGATINRAIQAAGDFETLSTSFKVLTGDIKVANALIKELNEFSLVTPFTPEQVNNAARTLLGFGRSASIVKDDLKLIGEAAAATGADLQSLALVFGQVAGVNKLQQQDANQFITAGIPLYQLLEKTLGKSTAQLKELQSQGKITFADLRLAFKEAAEEGGQFYKALEEQSKTFNGLKSTFQGFIGEALRGIGNIFLPAAKQTLTALIDLTRGFVDFINNNTESIRDFINQIGNSFSKSIQPLTQSFRRLFRIIGENTSVLEYFEALITTISQRLFIINKVASGVINVFSNTLSSIRDIGKESKSLSNVFSFFYDLIANFPAVFNGALEAIKLFTSNLLIDFDIATDKLRQIYLRATNLFGRNDQEIALIQFEIETKFKQKSDETLFQAYQRGVEEVKSLSIDFKPIKKEAEEEGFKTGTTFGEGFNTGLDETVDKEKTFFAIGTLGELQQRLSAINKLLTNAKPGSEYFDSLIASKNEAEAELKKIQDLISGETAKETTQGGISQIIAEQIRLNTFLSQNTQLTEEEIAKAVEESARRQINAQKAILQAKLATLSVIGGSPEEIQKLVLEISKLDVELANLGKGGQDLTGFDSLLRKLFPKGDLDVIKGELSTIYNELLNLANDFAQQRQQILDQEYEAARQRVDNILNLSENASQQQLDFEKQRLEETAKARDRFAKRSQAAARIEAAANILAAIAKISAESGVASFATLPAWIALIGSIASAATQVFHEGTENVTKDRKGSAAPRDLRYDEVPAILQTGERVIDRNLNKQIAGMTNKELINNAIIGRKIKSSGISPAVITMFQQNQGNSAELKKIRSSIESLEQTMKKLSVTSQSVIDKDGISQMVEASVKKYKDQIKRLR